MSGEASQGASATPGLLAEQARTLVQTEEARFASAQSRATTLLAVAGVIASLGGGVLTGLDGRSYALLIQIAGVEVSVVLIIACVTGAIAIVSLLWSGAVAMGALQEKPDPHPQKLIPVIKQQFPEMLDKDPAESSRVLLFLLAVQLEVIQAATAKVSKGLRRSARLLGVAVAAGLVLSVLILFGSSAGEQRGPLSKNEENRSHLVARSR